MRQVSLPVVIALATSICSLTAYAAPVLWPWDDARCFRASINPCSDTETWVSDDKLPARCGCLETTDYFEKDICELAEIICDTDRNEIFSTLFDKNDGSEIGCGCFATEDSIHWQGASHENFLGRR